MNITKSAISLLIVSTTLATASQASAEFTFEVPPSWRGAPQTEFSGWESFTVPFGGGNVPDLAMTTSDDALLEQGMPGGILTSTGNIYHPASSPTFVISDSVPGDLISVSLQVRVFGTPLLTHSPELRFLSSTGQTVTVPHTSYVALGTAQGAEEYKFTWDLCPEIETVQAYEVFFEGAGPHVSLDRVHLDTRFDGRCGGRVGINYCVSQVNSSGMPASIAAVGSDLVSDNELELTVSNLPLNEFGYFLVGESQGLILNPGGSAGNLCLSGALGRFNHASLIGNSGVSGGFMVDVDISRIPTNPAQSVIAGQSWRFQCWYRDGLGSNFSDAVSIDFQ